MPRIEIDVTNEVGIHARPASKFVKLAAQFKCDIQVYNLTADSGAANAKSILGVLALGVKKGHRISIEADGAQGEEALRMLEALIHDNFGELKR